MEEEECRFCQVPTLPQCPKLNGLTSQLVQYHYGEKFYFYFAKPINDILSGERNAEGIHFKELCFSLMPQRLPMKKFKSFQVLATLRDQIRKKKHANFQPCLANHQCWKIISENRGEGRHLKTTGTGCSRRRRPAGLYPLREGSVFGKILPPDSKNVGQPGGHCHFADVGGSFSTKVFDIYSPEYSSVQLSISPQPEKRKSSVFLETNYEKCSKPRVPLLDIKKLVQTKSAGHMLKTSGDARQHTLSKGKLQGSTHNYSTQMSLEASRSKLVAQYTKGEEVNFERNRKRRKTTSTSKKRSNKLNEEKPSKSKPKREKSGPKLQINVKPINPLEKQRSPSSHRGWSDFFCSKKNAAQILKTYRQNRNEAKLSIIGTEVLSSRTAKSKPKLSTVPTKESFAKKNKGDNFASPRVQVSSSKQLKHVPKIDSISRPTLQLVKEQLAKLSGKDSASKLKLTKTLPTATSTSKKRIESMTPLGLASPQLKLPKNAPLVMSHRLMPQLNFMRSTEDLSKNFEIHPASHRLSATHRKSSMKLSPSKSTARKSNSHRKSSSRAKDSHSKVELFSRNLRKPGKKKSLIIAVNN